MTSKKHIVLDKSAVEHIAKLVNISLSSSEVEKYAKELTSTLTYVESLDKIDTSTVSPTFQTTGLTNRFLEKQENRTLSQQKSLQNAHESKNGYFRINALKYSK